MSYDIEISNIKALDLPVEKSTNRPLLAYVKVKWLNTKFKTNLTDTHRWSNCFKITWEPNNDPSIIQLEVWYAQSTRMDKHYPLGSLTFDLRHLQTDSIFIASFPLVTARGHRRAVAPSLTVSLLRTAKHAQATPAVPLWCKPNGVHNAGTTPSQPPKAPSQELLPSPVPRPADAMEHSMFWTLLANTNNEPPKNQKAPEPEQEPIVQQMIASIPCASEEDIRNALEMVNYESKEAAFQQLAILLSERANQLTSKKHGYLAPSSEDSSRASSLESSDTDSSSSNSTDKNEWYSSHSNLPEIDSRGRKKKHLYQSPSGAPSGGISKKQYKNYKKRNSKRCKDWALRNPAEEKMKQLLPYCSVEDIQGALKKHNYDADAALDELLDNRITKIGQTVQLMGTSIPPPAVCSDFSKTFTNFFEQNSASQPQKIQPGVVGPETTYPSPKCSVAPLVYDSPDDYIPESGCRKALLIGINYTGTKKELKGCIEDTKHMKKLLTSIYGFPDDECSMTVLTDDTNRPELMPTKKNIILAMRWLVGNVEPGSVLFFHFSGHGSQRQNLYGTEMDGLDETILPVDYRTAGHLIDDELFHYLVEPLKNGVKLTCVMDCCHSGSGMDLPFIWNSESRQWDTELFPKFSSGDVQLFAGCADEETSADYHIPHMESGGAMTKALRQALANNPFGHTYPSLMMSIESFLRSWGFKQRPQLSTGQKFTFDRPFSLHTIVPNCNKLLGIAITDPKRARRKKTSAVPKCTGGNHLLPPMQYPGTPAAPIPIQTPKRNSSGRTDDFNSVGVFRLSPSPLAAPPLPQYPANPRPFVQQFEVPIPPTGGIYPEQGNVPFFNHPSSNQYIVSHRPPESKNKKPMVAPDRRNSHRSSRK